VALPATASALSRLETLELQATDSSGQTIAGVEWFLDGQPYGTEDTTAPYALSVPLPQIPAGSHTFHAYFRTPSGTTASTQTFSFSLPPRPLQGDINQDGTVNTLDWGIMNSQWFTSNPQSDLNADGFVNSIDFGLMNANWGMVG
jgi:hypothetical protein